MCREDADVSLHELHRMSCTYLQQELKQISFNLESGDLERVYYPHYLSHPIGIGECPVGLRNHRSDE